MNKNKEYYLWLKLTNVNLYINKNKEYYCLCCTINKGGKKVTNYVGLGFACSVRCEKEAVVRR